MSESRFKTMRHIETVRNYLLFVIKELVNRAVAHDQSKLEPPELEYFEKYTPMLRDIEYGSLKYRDIMHEMKPAIDHHNRHNNHHPEHFPDGIQGMNLIDLIEMICDWKAASLRHSDGDIKKSIEINQKRFVYSDELKTIFHNTADLLEMLCVPHKADES